MGRNAPFARRETCTPRGQKHQSHWRGRTVSDLGGGSSSGRGFSHQNLIANVLVRSAVGEGITESCGCDARMKNARTPWSGAGVRFVDGVQKQTRTTTHSAETAQR